jgi:hypothetical protein
MERTYNRYCGENLVGRPPFDDRMMDAARETMAFMASQTLPPSDNKPK